MTMVYNASIEYFKQTHTLELLPHPEVNPVRDFIFGRERAKILYANAPARIGDRYAVAGRDESLDALAKLNAAMNADAARIDRLAKANCRRLTGKSHL